MTSESENTRPTGPEQDPTLGAEQPVDPRKIIWAERTVPAHVPVAGTGSENEMTTEAAPETSTKPEEDQSRPTVGVLKRPFTWFVAGVIGMGGIAGLATMDDRSPYVQAPNGADINPTGPNTVNPGTAGGSTAPVVPNPVLPVHGEPMETFIDQARQQSDGTPRFLTNTQPTRLLNRDYFVNDGRFSIEAVDVSARECLKNDKIIKISPDKSVTVLLLRNQNYSLSDGYRATNLTKPMTEEMIHARNAQLYKYAQDGQEAVEPKNLDGYSRGYIKRELTEELCGDSKAVILDDPEFTNHITLVEPDTMIALDKYNVASEAAKLTPSTKANTASDDDGNDIGDKIGNAVIIIALLGSLVAYGITVASNND